MLSLANAFGGLSATELLRLFGVKSSSASSGATSKSTAQSSSTGISGSTANDPANEIKAILAQAQNATNAIQTILTQAQIAQAPPAPSGGASASSAVVETAYAAYSDPTPEGSSGDVAAEAGYAQTSESASGETAEITTEATGNLNAEGNIPGGVNYLASTTFTSTSSASGSIDTFQATVDVGGDSVTVEFALDGLGQVKLGPGGTGIDVGSGDFDDFFQINVGAFGQGVGQAFNVFGLDATQAQDLAAEFNQAISAPPNAPVALDTGYNYTGSEGPDFSVGYSEIVGRPGPFS
jgi:hypothetical protein